MNNKRFSVGRINISITNLKHSLKAIDNAITNNKPNYICVTNSRTARLANINEDYCKIQNNSLITVPDGVPLVWIAHMQGYKNVERTCGPDLMNELFKISVQKNYSHYFYGSTPETIMKIKTNLNSLYPGIKILGAVSPPFQPIDSFDINTLAEEINNLNPTFFWCGLGAPKQEYLISMLQTKLTSTICVGVGLAFEYIGGSVKRAPKWMRKIGLEGIYRLSIQPYNIKRAFIPYLWMIKQLIINKFYSIL